MAFKQTFDNPSWPTFTSTSYRSLVLANF
jgi:hypothetical protein